MTTLIKVITLSSSHSERLNGESLSNVKFNFPHVHSNHNHIHFNTVSIQSAEIPHSFYNVDENHNIVQYRINDAGSLTDYTMTISEGQYNANTFISTFQTLFASDSHGKTCTMTLDKITGKFSLTPATDNNFSISILTSGSTAFRILGLDASQDHTFSYSVNGTPFSYPCNFLGVTKLKIFSEALASDNLDSAVLGSTNLIDTISVNAPSFGLITFNSNQHNECIIKRRSIDVIDLQIRDERNNLIDFKNQDWSITLTIESTTDEDFKPTKEFGALINLQQRARMIKKLKENHKDARVMDKLLKVEEEYEEDISELSDDDLELILEIPDQKK